MSTQIIHKLIPFRLRRHMPARGTDTLHITRIGIGRSFVVHYRRPVVQIAVRGHIAGTVVWIVAARICFGGCSRRTKWYRSSASIVRTAEVFTHPALVANLHCVIDIVIVVCNRSVIRAWLCIACRNSQCGERDFLSIACPHIVGGISPYIIHCTRRQTGQFTGECSGSLSVNRMKVVHRRIRRSAPANTLGSHIATTRGFDITTRLGCP